jgi:DNA ligase 1
MKLPILYKRAKTGKIVSYEISVETTENTHTIIKLTGQLKGKKTTHREEITQGKQKRTPKQQAEMQAASDWKKKKDEGYKTLEDLGLTLDTIENMPAANTDASGNVKPMLALAYSEKKLKLPCFIQPKLDGVRCLMVLGKDSVKFLSRNGKEYTTLGHIERTVLSALKEYPYLRDTILDGELYAHDISFQAIVSAVKKRNADTVRINLRVYDKVLDADHTVRLSAAAAIVMTLNSPHITFVPTHLIKEKAKIDEYFSEYIAQGYEGAMLRLTDTGYEAGARSASLLKVKEFDETEFDFREFRLGQRGVEDLIGTFACKGDIFDAKFMGSRDEKARIYERYAYHQTPLRGTIKHFGYTDEGKPRFPICKIIRDYE